MYSPYVASPLDEGFAVLQTVTSERSHLGKSSSAIIGSIVHSFAGPQRNKPFLSWVSESFVALCDLPEGIQPLLGVKTFKDPKAFVFRSAEAELAYHHSLQLLSEISHAMLRGDTTRRRGAFCTFLAWAGPRCASLCSRWCHQLWVQQVLHCLRQCLYFGQSKQLNRTKYADG